MTASNRQQMGVTAARGLLFVAIASALSACASLSNDSAGPRIGWVADYASSHSLTAPVGAWPTESWWQSYDDAQLDALIREALAGSPNIAVAGARLRRAQAAAQIADAARRPQASASAAATQQKHSYNYLTPRELTPQGWDDYASASLTFSWQLDSGDASARRSPRRRPRPMRRRPRSRKRG